MASKLVGALAFFTIVLPAAQAAPPSSPAATQASHSGLTAKQRQLVDEVLSSYHPYECCTQSLGACLREQTVCPLAARLERAVVRMAAAGLDRPRIEAALAHRQATMGREQPSAKIALDERFRAGNPKAAVVLAIYACPRNPICAKLIPDLYREVTAGRLKDKVALHYRPFFPTGDENALECGRGLYAAAYQGQFWPYLLHLCLERESLKKTTMRDWVGSHGLDRCIFDHTCDQPGTATWLAASREEGVANGVTSAPTAFVNGRRIHGELELETVVDLLEEEHERVTQPRAPAKAQQPAATPAQEHRSVHKP
jgi:protein-disulfide isomerase